MVIHKGLLNVFNSEAQILDPTAHLSLLNQPGSLFITFT